MKQSKITLLVGFGAGFEYYDYVMYAILASFINQNFFPSNNKFIGLFATFGVFALGNIIRPIGGIILGMIGDRCGRKNIFTISMILMSAATFIMGITPSYCSIGIGGTIIFSLCRILQTITCGAEIPNATTFLLEHIQEKARGIHFGFMSSFIGLGSSFGLLIAYFLTKFLTENQMVSFGFRLPFIFGGLLAFVGFFIRRHIPETPAFLKMTTSHSKPPSFFSKDHITQTLLVIGVLIFPACLVVFFLTLPVYLHDIYHYAYHDIYLAMTIGSLWTSCMIPVFGAITDRFIGRKLLLTVVALVFIALSIPMFSLLSLNNKLGLYGFVIAGKTIIAAMAASYFVILPQAFKIEIRCTGTAFSYNVAYTIAAVIPLAMNYIYGMIGRPIYITLILTLLATITAVSTMMIKIRDDKI